MAQDAELMKLILRKVDQMKGGKQGNINSPNIEIGGFSEDEIMENCLYLLNSGFIRGHKTKTSQFPHYPVVMIHEITDQGFTFLAK